MDAADIERAPWMEAADVKILAYLYRHKGEILGPSTIAKNTRRTDGDRYHADYISHRLADLVAAGLIDKLERGEYRLSDLGVEYVEGEVEPGDPALEFED